MSTGTKLTDQITIGAQPTDDVLAQLQREGFKSIVNLRTEGEENQPLSPDEEGEKARALGLEYAHVPVSGDTLRPELADRFCGNRGQSVNLALFQMEMRRHLE
jgi:uncharacterized protein (TIGR01244 family)